MQTAPVLAVHVVDIKGGLWPGFLVGVKVGPAPFLCPASCTGARRRGALRRGGGQDGGGWGATRGSRRLCRRALFHHADNETLGRNVMASQAGQVQTRLIDVVPSTSGRQCVGAR